MRRPAKFVALGGMLSALALVIMCLGSIVPVATFVCPALAMITGQITVRLCGKRIGWCWYGTVAILSLLLSFDKESATVFVFLGYYPIIKSWFERYKFAWIGKCIYFNVSVAVMYFLLLRLFGLAELSGEYAELSRIGVAILLVLGNVTFYLLDIILTRCSKKK